ncbi:MAG: S9 family peptidase, partial [Acidobacteria bacterium]|nr:S9 family peptidase [Acidobacteriota bacterium]
RPHVPCDLAVGTINAPAPRVITAVNQDLLGTKTLGEVEELWYTSSLDGRRIQGWIIKPPHFDPLKKYPLILEIHGGPHLAYGDRFDVEKQLMAARDYVVFYPNSRGSTGYGFEFAHLLEKVWPGIAGDDRNPGDIVHDLISGVDAVIAKGYVDSDNLFVSGLSAGGSFTFWTIARTNRFRAAVAQAPSGANWFSFALYANRPAVMRYRFPGLPWEYTDHYQKRSPLSVINRVKTPTMIITGEEDYLTPMPNSEEYYAALKWLKVETVLIQIPGEPHVMWRYPSHHVSKMLHTLSWIDQHKTKGPS